MPWDEFGLVVCGLVVMEGVALRVTVEVLVEVLRLVIERVAVKVPVGGGVTVKVLVAVQYRVLPPEAARD